MTALLQRLRAIEPLITDILSITGTPGVSYGVQHLGGPPVYGNLGYRDVENKLPATETTVYHIGSLTKFFTAAAAGILVEDGKIEWTAPVQRYLPEFVTLDDERVSKEATMFDLLSHRTGLAQKLDIWLEGGNQLLLPKSETIKTIGYLEQVHPFRSRWQYNNWPYCLAGEVIERVSGQSYGTFLVDNIFQPLDMQQTVIDPECVKVDEIATAYMPLNDGTPFKVPSPQIADGTLMVSAGGIRSSVKDLLTFYTSVLAGGVDQFKSSNTSTPGCPLKQLSVILSGHIPLSTSSLLERSYALGMVRTQLPGPLGDVGYNGIFLPSMPVVNSGSSAQLVLYHQGSMPGFTSSVFLIPDMECVIVVLTNSLGISDSADWIGQLLLQTLFDPKEKNDYVHLARESVSAALKMYDQIEDDLARDRIPSTEPRPLGAYCGRYYNRIGNLFLEITELNGVLQLSFQGIESETYRLKHYHNDVFTWHVTRDEDVKRARFTVMDASFYKIVFGSSTEVDIDQLIWAHEPDIPTGEVFKKEHLKAS